MKPYDVNIVTDYMILRLNSDESMNLINLKLQKLLYYLQAWSLGINNERFINCSFEAWVHGPVCRQIYDRLKGQKNLYSLITTDDLQTQEPNTLIEAIDIEFINFILDNYAGFSGTELETMTHKETPWIETRRGLNPMQGCNKEIPEDMMQTYYGKKWHQLNG